MTKKEISNVCRKLNIFFLPLQGFFNFLIFAGNKLHVIYQANHEISFFGALRTLFASNSSATVASNSSAWTGSTMIDSDMDTWIKDKVGNHVCFKRLLV